MHERVKTLPIGRKLHDDEIERVCAAHCDSVDHQAT